MRNNKLDLVLSERLSDLIPACKNNHDDIEKKSQRQERNIDIYTSYFGLDGLGGLSMEKAGSEYGLTRESVRQITDKITVNLKMNKTPIPELEYAIKVIDGLIPASAEYIEDHLVNLGVFSERFKIEGIVNSAIIFGLKTKVSKIITVNGKRFVVQSSLENAPKKILSRATKEISHNGAVNLELLTKEVMGVNEAIKFKFITDVLNTVETCSWFNERWVHFNDKGINRLSDRLKRIFSINETVDINKLHEGIERNWRKNKKDRTNVLPKNVLKAFILSLDEYIVSDNGIVSAKSPLNSCQLSDMEVEMYEVLSKSTSGEMNEKKLEDMLVGHRPDKKYSFSQVLNFSPIICKVQRGVYSTVGKPRDNFLSQ